MNVGVSYYRAFLYMCDYDDLNDPEEHDPAENRMTQQALHNVLFVE